MFTSFADKPTDRRPDARATIRPDKLGVLKSINYQIWVCFPNMVMVSKYGHVLQTVKLKQYAVFFRLTYLLNVPKA